MLAAAISGYRSQPCIRNGVLKTTPTHATS
jgi:hypothetical protein